jgi:hypothetical protein
MNNGTGGPSNQISGMPMRERASSIHNGFNQRSDREQQSREKEYWMYRDAETDCESDQQSCRRWFENCKQHFFHNASFVCKNMGRRRLWR